MIHTYSLQATRQPPLQQGREQMHHLWPVGTEQNLSSLLEEVSPPAAMRCGIRTCLLLDMAACSQDVQSYGSHSATRRTQGPACTEAERA